MGSFKTKIIDNTICSKLSEELDITLTTQWVDKLEEIEASTTKSLNRFHDITELNAVHLSFDDLWGIAQRRLKSHEKGHVMKTAFWVSTPLNYGISRMYQAFTEDTPYQIEVFYNIEDVAIFLEIDVNKILDVKY